MEEEKTEELDKIYKIGVEALNNKKFEIAIESFEKCLESEEYSNNNIDLWDNLGMAYISYTLHFSIEIEQETEYYQKGIKCFQKSNSISPLYNRTSILKSLYKRLGLIYIRQINFELAIKKFQLSKCHPIEVFPLFATTIKKLPNKIYEIASALKDPLFDHLISEDDKYQKEYKSIYLKSLYIVSLLHVNKEEENKVAHYTQKTVVEKLLIKENGKDQVSPFRLNTVATANDPKEGMPLLSYLGIEKDSVSEDYQAFVGSFIFNPDSLNQFRLYGKKDNQEATGVSIVVSKDYFSSETTPLQMIKDAQIDMKGGILPDDNEKQALYRCIYLDPKTSQVISVGHKEEYTFYREQDKVLKKTIKEYNKYRREIDKLIEEVRENLADLREEIELLMEQIEKDFKAESRQKEEKRNAQTKIATLLTHLRYLTKHVAFKEEQECRVISVERLRDNDKIQTEDNARMFIDYLPMRNGDQCYVTDVYFAPRTTGFELFKNILKNNGIDIPCHQCDHPFI